MVFNERHTHENEPNRDASTVDSRKRMATRPSVGGAGGEPAGQ